MEWVWDHDIRPPETVNKLISRSSLGEAQYDCRRSGGKSWLYYNVGTSG